MLKRRSLDLHINHERWLVSYADFVTLLFAFFVVMYSVSQINESKYEELTSTLNGFFSEQKSTDEAKQAVDSSSASVIELPTLETAFYQQLLPLIEEGAIEVSSNELWLQISLSNRILFDVGSVKPSDQANEVVAKIATIMKDTVNPIRVEGFTDNLAINTAQFPSNWQLSTARASAIVQLLSASGVSPSQLSAVGYGEFQPVADNSSEAGRAKNRRVVLMIGKFKENRPVTNTSASDTPSEHRSLNKLSRPHEAPIKTPVDTFLGNTHIAPVASSETLTPITLKNGELLFTNDPATKDLIINGSDK
jgi:chemotaxis protein MotB